jgi:hypothetical protein
VVRYSVDYDQDEANQLLDVPEIPRHKCSDLEKIDFAHVEYRPLKSTATDDSIDGVIISPSRVSVRRCSTF